MMTSFKTTSILKFTNVVSLSIFYERKIEKNPSHPPFNNFFRIFNCVRNFKKLRISVFYLSLQLDHQISENGMEINSAYFVVQMILPNVFLEFKYFFSKF